MGGSCGVIACGTPLTSKVYSNRKVVGSGAAGTVYNTLNPAYNAITGVFSNINSSYNAMTVDITNRGSKLISYDVNYTAWVNMISFLNLAVVGLILSTFTTRFIFPMLSLEGRRFWILSIEIWNLFRIFGA